MQTKPITYQIIITQVTPNCWEWNIRQADKVLAGGYCRTAKAARNDAGIVFAKLELA